MDSDLKPTVALLNGLDQTQQTIPDTLRSLLNISLIQLMTLMFIFYQLISLIYTLIIIFVL